MSDRPDDPPPVDPPPVDAPAPVVAVSWRRLLAAIGATVVAMVIVAGATSLVRSASMVVRSLTLALCATLLLAVVVVVHRMAFPPGERDRLASSSRALVFLALVDLGAVAVMAAAGSDEVFVAGAVVALVATSLLVSEGRRLVRHDHRAALPPAVLATSVLVLALLRPGLGVIVAALVLVIVAADLGAEWMISVVADVPRRAVATATTLSVLAGFVGLCVWGVNPLHAVAITLVVVGVALATAVDGDALVLVLAVGGLILVAAVPTDDATFDPELQARRGQPYTLVLGDSFTSGEGANRYLAGTNTIAMPSGDEMVDTADAVGQCRRSPRAWALRVAEQADDDEDFAGVSFEACSGAVTEQIADQVARHASRELGPPSLVVIGIGGNDVGFSDIGKACVGPGSCVDVAERFTVSRDADPEETGADLEDEPLADLDDDLRRAFRVAVEAAEGAPVVAVPYPIPVRNGSDPCFGALLDGSERDFIVSFVRALNETIEEVAAQEGIGFMATMEDAFEADELRLCDRPGTGGINFVAFNAKTGSVRSAFDPGTWTHNSFHPNDRGHEAMAEAAVTWLASDAPDPMVRTSDRAVLDEMVVAGRDVDGSVEEWVQGEVGDLFRVGIVPVAVIAVGAWFGWCAVVRAVRDRQRS